MKLSISKDVVVSADELTTGRTCVIGQSGSGKSYAVAVICEELAKNNIGFCIIDTEGEYFSLKEKYEILWIGNDDRCNINIEEVDYERLARKSIKDSLPIIFDVSEADAPEEKVGNFLSVLYKVESKIKQPYLLIVEEVDKFAPQRGNVIPEIEEISRRGRKRGLGMLIATQRPALVNKNILSQCGNQLVGKLTIKNDLDSVRPFFEDVGSLEKLPGLKPGQFFIQGNFSGPKFIKIRKRETRHKAVTPKIIRRKSKAIKNLDEFKADLLKKTDENIDIEEIRTIGFKPQISEEDAFQRIKKATRKFKFFGKTALVSNLHIVLRPIFSCDIKYLRKRVIGREFLAVHSYFDGVTGNVVYLDKGFSIKFRIKDFLGLTSNDLEIFRIIQKSKKITSAEIAYQIKMSVESVRNSIKSLLKRRLINYKKVGRNKLYFLFTKSKLPKISKLSKAKVESNRLKLKAKKMKSKIEPMDLSTFVRGLDKKADIVSERKVYYPFYKATVVFKKSKKDIVMDALTGKFIKTF